MKKILLVEDEAPLRTLVRITLEDPVYSILEAADGETALRMAIEARPDLIVLDWMIPGISGIKVAERLRRDEDTRRIPIIMLTARAEEQDRKAADSLGVFSFIVKPFSPLQLLKQVEAALRL